MPDSTALTGPTEPGYTWPQTLAAWLMSYTSENTRAAYRADGIAWTSWCHSMNVDPVHARRPHVDAWVQQLTVDQLRPATISRRVAAISSLYRYAADLGVVDRNPAAMVRRPKPPEISETRWLTGNELKAFIGCAAEHGPRDHAIALLLALNALRSNEVRTLRADEIGAYGGYTTILIHGKGGRDERVPIPQITADIVDEHLGDRDDGYVFTGGNLRGWIHDRPETHLPATVEGQDLSAQQLGRIVTRLANRAGINSTRPKVTPHSLRHSAITAALDAGVDIRFVEAMARHADPKSTRRYDRTRTNVASHASMILAKTLLEP